MDNYTNVIPSDTYADNLLRNVAAIKPAMLITKDAYAEDLLYNIEENKVIRVLPNEKIIPANPKTPEY